MIFLFSLFFVLIVVGMPIVFVLGVSSTLALLFITDVPVAIVAQRIYAGLDSFTLMAIPFFVFCGAIMDVGGISRRIADFAGALVGWITGSLLHVGIVMATVLSTISGSGSADTAAVAAILRPEFVRRKYDIDFAAAMVASAGCLGPIIPPSLTMVVVAMVSNMSVGALFLAGFLPGLLTAAGLILTSYAHAKRGGPQYREIEPFTLARLWKTFWAAIPALGMPFLILGGIVGGIFTPTEAAAVAVWYGLIVGMFVYRELKLKDLPMVILRSAMLASMVAIIIGTAAMFAWLIANADVPRLIGAWFQEVATKPWTFLLLVNVVLMLVGCFMESIAAILIIVPILMPIAISYGIDPIHFGLVVVMNLSIGMITPPYGITLYVSSAIFQRSVVQVARRMFWPWAIMTIVLLLTTYVPWISLIVPQMAGFLN
ncbi:MAG: TRAP transporter large permease [Rhodospirillales bacterium]|nr:TRAP transporter large permease [Rhodospirillales bacterium]